MSEQVRENRASEIPEATVTNGWTGERAYAMYSSQQSFLLGKVLTTVDAAIAEKQQNKAIKDIIKQQFHDQEKHVYQICCGGQMLCATGEEMPPT